MTTVKIAARCLDEDLPALPRQIQIGFFARIDILRENPRHGKRLSGTLRDFYRLRLGRYRIVYHITPDEVVWIIAVGIRKEGARDDVYARLNKLLRSDQVTLE